MGVARTAGLLETSFRRPVHRHHVRGLLGSCSVADRTIRCKYRDHKDDYLLVQIGWGTEQADARQAKDSHQQTVSMSARSCVVVKNLDLFKLCACTLCSCREICSALALRVVSNLNRDCLSL